MNQYFAESDNLLSRCSVVSYGGIADVGGVLVMQKSEISTYIVFFNLISSRNYSCYFIKTTLKSTDTPSEKVEPTNLSNT